VPQFVDSVKQRVVVLPHTQRLQNRKTCAELAVPREGQESVEPGHIVRGRKKTWKQTATTHDSQHCNDRNRHANSQTDIDDGVLFDRDGEWSFFCIK
jgi:hypothetical protein